MAGRKKTATPDLFDNVEPIEQGPIPDLPRSWLDVLQDQFRQSYWKQLQSFVAQERETQTIFPPADEVFTAFHLTPFDQVRVLILGQDPYPGAGQAHGLSFSVKPGVGIPASLRNMYQELKDDCGIASAKSGHLIRWAEQGVLMLNAVMTVRAGAPNSHKNKGWETFTDAVIQAVSSKSSPVVFVLWGAYAQKKAKLIDRDRHMIVESAHPSPLSAHNGFFGSKPFSKINAALEVSGTPPIDWRV